LAGRIVGVIIERRCGIETVPASGAKAADALLENHGKAALSMRRFPSPHRPRPAPFWRRTFLLTGGQLPVSPWHQGEKKTAPVRRTGCGGKTHRYFRYLQRGLER